MTTGISSLSSSSSYSGISGTSHQKKNLIEEYAAGSGASVDIGCSVDKLSNFTKAVGSMSTDLKKELSDIMDTVKDSMKSGDFNAADILANASDELKAALSKKDVDFEETLNDIYNDYKKSKNQSALDYSGSLSGNAPKSGNLLEMLQGLVTESITSDTVDTMDANA